MILPSDPLGAAKRRAAREGWASHIRTAADEAALLAGMRWDRSSAERVEEFFATFLRHSKGEHAAKPFTLLDWQRDDLFYPLFGWLRLDDRGQWVRRFTKAYVEISKKNGKSTIASGVGLYMLVGDGEMGAEVYSVATAKDQAMIVHREAMNMVEASDDLREVLEINRSTKNILFPGTNSFYRALSADSNTNEGLNPHALIADELHAWTGAAGRQLYNCIQWGFAARRQPLFFQITTAGSDILTPCKEQHDYAKLILSGRCQDTRTFALIHAADPTDDPWSEATWRKANPSLGHTISLESFAADAEEAKQKPSEQAQFRRYRLGIWTTGDSPWITPERWEACRAAEFPQLETLAERRCVAALDLSRTRDSTALVFAWHDAETDQVHVRPHFWLPRRTAEDLRGVVPWEEWAAAGHCTLIDGEVIEYAFIERYFADLQPQTGCTELAYDPHFATDVTLRIQEQTSVALTPFGQTIVNFSAPTHEFERRVLNRSIWHDANPVLAWQMSNAVCRTDANRNKRPVKPAQHDHRAIDGVVAAIMALALHLRNAGEPVGRYYEDHDLEVG